MDANLCSNSTMHCTVAVPAVCVVMFLLSCPEHILLIPTHMATRLR